MKRKATLAGILLAMALALVYLPQAAQAETITLDGSQTTWEAGNTYQVNADTTIDTRVSTSGSDNDVVTLQLKEGCTLTIPKGIYVAENTHLKIIGPGKLVIIGAERNCAGIGANPRDARGKITIENATVNVQGGKYAAGIGAGVLGVSGDITISGSTVTATGGDNAAGIGGADNSDGKSGDITIENDSKVTATGGYLAAGIGGGKSGGCGDITISGGDVTATGGYCGAGIGGGYYDSNSGAITISSGTVTATGGEDAAGIGNGFLGRADLFQTGDDGKAVIFAKGDRGGINTNKNNEDRWTGIIFDGQNGKVYGNQTIDSDLTIPLQKLDPPRTLTVPADTTLTINAVLNLEHAKLDVENEAIVKGTGSIEPESKRLAAKITEFTTKDVPWSGQAVSGADVTSTLNHTAAPDQKVDYTWYDSKENKLSAAPKDAGSYYVTAAAKASGIYKEIEPTEKKPFKITPKSIAGCTVDLSPNVVTYNGKEQKPKVTVKDGETILTEDTDYTVNYEGNFTNAGTATVTIIGKGNYGTGKEEDNKSADFTINQKTITADDIILTPNVTIYNGKAQKPAVKVMSGDVELMKGTDYTISWSGSDFTHPNTLTLTVRGKTPNCTGSATKDYTIREKRQKDHDTSSGSSSSGHHSSSDKKSDSSKKDDTQEMGQTGDDTVAPTAVPETIFSDIHKGDWFYHDVCNVFLKGLMTGTGETTFEPQSLTTRAMLVAILHRMEGSPKATNAATFSDVAAGDWYAQAIAWAEEEGIADGYDAAHFGPNDAMTREQLAAFLMKYSAYKQRDVTARGDLSTFADAANVSDWAEDALRWAVATHLIGGKPDNLIAPQDLATRAELAAILTRYLS